MIRNANINLPLNYFYNVVIISILAGERICSAIARQLANFDGCK